MSRWFILLFVGVGFSHAATPVVMVDSSLNERAVRLQAFGGAGASFTDEEGKLATVPAERVLQLRVADRARSLAKSTTPESVIELTDGQRLPGEWVGASDDGQSVAWESPILGKIELGLDRLKSIRWKVQGPTDKAPTAGGANDRLLLANGDTLDGFITGLHGEGVEIKPAGGGDAIKLPLDRLRAARFANPATAAKGQSLICLADGTRLRATKVEIADDFIKADFVLKEKGGGAIPALALAGATRIDLATGAGVLVDLASLTPEVVSGGEVFGLPLPPRAEGGDVMLHAPVVVRYALPAGAKRFSADARSEAGGADAAAWVDFEAAASVDGKPAGKWRFNASSPRAAMNFPLDGKALTFELTSGVNGPVLDRLRLRDAVVLVESR